METDLMDNKLFNVNGKSKGRLELALELAFNGELAQSFIMDDKYGLIFSWSGGQLEKRVTPFPVPMNAKQCADIAYEWLNKSEFAKNIEPSTSCQKYEGGDVVNEYGWQVYCGDWGHVADIHSALCGIKPAWLWLGK